MSRKQSALAIMAALVLVAAIGVVVANKPDNPSTANPNLKAMPVEVATSPGPRPTGWWNDRVFYEIFVRSFQDSNGDGTGDLAGVTSRLDDLAALGVGGIWLMPIFESDTEHGYATTDYRSVEADYGSLADFDALLKEAHQRDIKVLLDFVPNHTSSSHPWFSAALTDPKGETASWYRFTETQPSDIGPYGPAWHAAPSNRWYFGLFGSQQPDLNLENPTVTAELTSSATWWLDRGVDGFRLDAAKHLVEDGSQYESTPQTIAWLESFQEKLRTHKPDVLTVAEVWSPTSSVSQYVPKSADLAFDFDLAKALVKAVRDQDEVDLLVELDIAATAFPKGQYASFLSNHDQPRVASAIGADPGNDNADAKVKQAASLLLTSPGIPFIYYGEELGTTGNKPDEQLRLPYPWDGSPEAGFSTGTAFRAPPASSSARNLAVQQSDPSSIWNHYRSLIKLKKSLPALSGGFARVNTPVEGAAAWLRTSGQQTLLVLHNVTDRSLRVPLTATDAIPPGKAIVRFGLPESVVVAAPDPTAEGAVTAWVPIEELPARTTVIFELGQ
jgi:alpha-amylase